MEAFWGFHAPLVSKAWALSPCQRWWSAGERQVMHAGTWLRKRWRWRQRQFFDLLEKENIVKESFIHAPHLCISQQLSYSNYQKACPENAWTYTHKNKQKQQTKHNLQSRAQTNTLLLCPLLAIKSKRRWLQFDVWRPNNTLAAFLKPHFSEWEAHCDLLSQNCNYKHKGEKVDRSMKQVPWQQTIYNWAFAKPKPYSCMTQI